MNLSPNRRMHPHLRDEEARIIENAIRLAIDSIINVMASVDCARTREHERVLAERDGEIKRLSNREKQFEHELQVLRRQDSGNGGQFDGAHVDHCFVFSDQPESSEPWPGVDEGGEARRGQREMRFSLGHLTTTPCQVSTPNESLATASPAKKSALQQTVASQPPDAMEVRQILLDLPVIKEEPSSMEACEASDLHTLVLLPLKPSLHTAPVYSNGDDACSSGESGEDEEDPGEEYRPSSPESEGQKTNKSHTWHYDFQIPWNKMSTNIKERLEMGERPSAAERREVIRVIAGELLATCKTTGKTHVLEVARQVTLAHPRSFQDEIAGEVVGSGYDSIVRQMMSHIYNVRRSENPQGGKRPGSNGGGKKPGANGGGRTSRVGAAAKRRRRDAYGCVNLEPPLPAGETRVTQRRGMEELQLMFRNKDGDAKRMEALMAVTFASQRKDILAAETGTKELLERWPYLFQAAGMRVHFMELTGVRISGSFEETTARKFQRILEYFQCLPTDPFSRACDLGVQTQMGRDPTCGVVLLLLTHFNEQQEKMFVRVDGATRPSDLDPTALPWTPCVVVCGECPLRATAYMVAVDQVVISERLATFGEALHVMFYSYYIHNMDYPAEISATMEFLQRCIFKINPNQGSKGGKQAGARRILMNQKVLSLLSRMSEFERR